MGTEKRFLTTGPGEAVPRAPGQGPFLTFFQAARGGGAGAQAAGRPGRWALRSLDPAGPPALAGSDLAGLAPPPRGAVRLQQGRSEVGPAAACIFLEFASTVSASQHPSGVASSGCLSRS